MLFIKLAKQSNGHLILTAPDGIIWSFADKMESKEEAEALSLKVGAAVLEIVNDPNQPKASVEPAPPQNPGPAAGPEGGPTTNAQVGSAVMSVLGFLRDISSDDGG